ncbi:bifunctional 5,10-methylenetetrahydrofolate dehydrogenase/5,10-methenyltetrahydrofolate cyclohydrolase [Sediminimonas sp.]|uniref:bifunctional 5,10-methylenetetrahydrofolate dehydrogenase/5,10-methenyltetrahydrofolate cyclohydrolase n=1 Tax=Sediminimonas sp. TaxID=2823379 RepID=UPI0025E09252|nr:bifunctional 5,10-methylenetetrahydrofolate dehydrogenase/5,10-methenyltetrahydrofolate cyclohydrolase [Sediminimonas sp.]
MRAAVIDGKAIAATIRAEAAEDAATLADQGWQPRLVSISVGDTAAAELYVRNQSRSAEAAGVQFETRTYPETISMEQLVGVLHGLNADPRQRHHYSAPIAGAYPGEGAAKGGAPAQGCRGDAPGLDRQHRLQRSGVGAVYGGAVAILKTLPLSLEGLDVTVIGHSEIVGKPIAFLLMGLGATVTVCHHMTRSVAMHSRAADAVFVAVGRAGLVTGEMIRPGAALIDIGINRVETDDGVRTVGDADFDSCAQVAGWITPVPGGVGPVTVATLMKNAVLATRMQMDHYRDMYARTDI